MNPVHTLALGYGANYFPSLNFGFLYVKWGLYRFCMRGNGYMQRENDSR